MAVNLTTTAAERVRQFMTTDADAVGLRLGVKVVGCSGYAYVVDLTDAVADDDSVFESNGIKVIVSSKSLNVVDGTEIDFSRDGLNEGFAYSNPNAKNMCGCGESFGV
ncbi:MAG: iron-sulfur cluster assembly protein [Gammaproteobacteria bacterium]|jgi:iron-sulfur cluster assembly protein